jgi:HD-GYP domain-containing protein (c-di-GMP phosphodiesterase class II)
LKILSIGRARSGMRLARPILSSQGTPLVQAGVELNDRYIDRLKQFGQAWIYVATQDSEGIEVEETIDERLKFEAAKAIREVTEHLADENLPEEKQQIDEKQASVFKSVVEEISDCLHESPTLSEEVLGLKSETEYFYLHGVNVAIIAVLLAVKAGWTREKIVQMGIGAILHDIGVGKIIKLGETSPNDQIPDSIYRHHARMGYEAIKKAPGLKATSANVALRHHEHWDGSGYPEGLKGKDIHEFSRIVSVANLYDQLISPRPWRTPVPPDVAMDVVQSQSGTRLDPTFCQLFTLFVDPYPVGMEVELDNGLVGIVALSNADNRRRPIVRIVRTVDERYLEKPILLDLLQKPDIKIVRAML